ncbi:ATP-binding cassette domain-containing protein [Georgenia phoenicis]|uniref:ATP-binding cassette domain-containing protein n=1 Tax=unclassified Georgenia TaxID=2626815 RepID=UPI0039B11DA6
MSTTRSEPAILAEDLRKSYPGRGAVLDGLDLEVSAGSVHGLIGANGAGKTTAVRILTTLVRLDSGRARVAGRDVATDPRGVREHISMAGQYAAVDEVLSGRQNLQMFAQLDHLRPGAARRRTAELLERFDLVAAADRPVHRYSGGMRRRLDLAVSLIRRPHVLFLDEPTTGLDPRSRAEVWNAVRELAQTGTTVLLTTQYLNEADRLCSQVSLVGAGRIVAEGTPADLKARIGGSRVEVRVPAHHDVEHAAATLSTAVEAVAAVDRTTREIALPMRGGTATLVRLARALDHAGVRAEDVSLRPPDLDEVFLHLTSTVVEGAAG